MRLNKKQSIENYEDKLLNIKNVLKDSDTPLDYKQIGELTGLSAREAHAVIIKCFSNEAKQTMYNAIETADFMFFANKVKNINKSFWYNVMKGRLDIGKSMWRKTGGLLK
jgi:ribosome recycling factor